jgi:hypothetical protein
VVTPGRVLSAPDTVTLPVPRVSWQVTGVTVECSVSRTRRCFETAGSRIAKGAVSSVTVAGPMVNRAARRQPTGALRSDRVKTSPCSSFTSI